MLWNKNSQKQYFSQANFTMGKNLNLFFILGIILYFNLLFSRLKRLHGKIFLPLSFIFKKNDFFPKGIFPKNFFFFYFFFF